MQQHDEDIGHKQEEINDLEKRLYAQQRLQEKDSNLQSDIEENKQLIAQLSEQLTARTGMDPKWAVLNKGRGITNEIDGIETGNIEPQFG